MNTPTKVIGAKPDEALLRMAAIPNIPEWLKLSPKYLVPVAIVTGVFALGSDSLLNRFGLKSLQQAYRPLIGGTFLLSCALLLLNFGAYAFDWIRTKILLARRRKRLHVLTAEEKELLQPFICNRTRTQKLHVMSGVVGGLEAAGIIYLSAKFSNAFAADYNIQSWAWDYLNKH